MQWVGTSTDVDDQQRSSNALRFLAAASAELSASLDYRKTLANVAHLAIPQVADFCVLAITGPDGHVARLAAVHVDPTMLPHLEALGDHDLGDPATPGSAGQVMRTGRCALIEDLDPGARGDDPRRHLLQAVGARSWLCVPIHGARPDDRRDHLGAAGSGRRFSPPTCASPRSSPCASASPWRTPASTTTPRRPTAPRTSSSPPSRTSCAPR